jgi:hypothetical protein
MEFVNISVTRLFPIFYKNKYFCTIEIGAVLFRFCQQFLKNKRPVVYSNMITAPISRRNLRELCRKHTVSN